MCVQTVLPKNQICWRFGGVSGASLGPGVGDDDVKVPVAVLDDLHFLIRDELVVHIIEHFGQSSVVVADDNSAGTQLDDGLQLSARVLATEHGQAEADQES